MPRCTLTHLLGKAAYEAYGLFLAYFGFLSLIGDGGFGGAAVVKKAFFGSKQYGREELVFLCYTEAECERTPDLG